jgi:hypothetical protein
MGTPAVMIFTILGILGGTRTFEIHLRKGDFCMWRALEWPQDGESHKALTLERLKVVFDLPLSMLGLARAPYFSMRLTACAPF